MKGSTAVAAAAARWTRSTSRFHGGGGGTGGCGGRLVGGVAIDGTNNNGGAVSRTSCARMSSLAFTHNKSLSQTTAIARSATAAAPATAKNRSSLVVDLQHHRPQQQQQQQQQWRHLVMITKTKAGDNTVDDAAADLVDTATLNTKNINNNITPTNQQNPTQHAKQLLHITEACWNKIEQLAAAKRQQDLYLRLVIDAGGCSGFSYKFEFDTDQNLAGPEEDIVFTRTCSTNDENSGGSSSSDPMNSFALSPRVVVDAGSLEFIQGSTIDYVQEMIKSSFQVRDNPQSESACGCGSSFAVKNFTANPALD
jgi:iron-sulfur cluster assembly 2